MKIHLQSAPLTVGFLLCCILGSWTEAHDGTGDHSHPPIAVQPDEMYAPSAIPDRVILTLNGDPRVSVAVNWRTSVEVARGIAEIAKAEAGPYFPEKAQQFEATSQALKTDINTAHYHSVSFQNLEPGTTYAYRVGDEVNWTEWYQFRTAAAEDEPFSFVYFGDAQNDIRSMWSRVIREAYRDAPQAAFLLHAGDLINHAESDAEWGEWFGAGGWINSMTPNLAIPGNHEQSKLPSGLHQLSHHWQAVFSFPENGPRGLEESCYTLTYNNLRIIGLNSNTMHREQAAWMEEVLAKNVSPWVICTFHHPIFSTGEGRDNPELRALWKPIFDKHKVDLVLQGHDHTYGRTGFQVPNTPEEMKAQLSATQANISPTDSSVGDVNVATGFQQRDANSGTVYVVSVSGPKMYENSRYGFMKRIAEDTQLYQIIRIDGTRLHYEAKTAIGELYDAFDLQKQDKDVNELIELEVEASQNLRTAPSQLDPK